MRNFRIGTTLLAAAAVSAALLLSACNRDDANSDPSAALPQQLDSRVKLRAGEKIRVTHYQPGTDRRLDAEVNFSGGETGEMTYRTDGPGAGNLKHAKIFYKAHDGSEHGTIKREFELDADGFTFLRDRKYYADGTVQHKSDRLSDVAYESTDFYTDGRTVSLHRMFDRDPKDSMNKGWKLRSEEAYRESGSLQRKYVLNKDKSAVTDEYSPAAVLVSHTVLNEFATKRDQVVYAEDGKTKVKEIEQGSATKISIYENGHVARALEFGWEYSYLNDTAFDANGKPTIKRSWYAHENATDAQKAGKVKGTDYRISTVYLYDASGEEIGNYYWDSQGRLRSVDIRAADGKTSTVRMFTENGMLTREVTRELEPFKIVATKDYEPAVPTTLPATDPNWLQPAEFDEPPATLPNAKPYHGPGY